MSDLKYCKKCGAKLLKSTCGADEIKIWYPDSIGGCFSKVGSRFHPSTGKRNIAEIFTCPKWKGGLLGRLFNNHDKIVDYNGEYYWV